MSVNKEELGRLFRDKITEVSDQEPEEKQTEDTDETENPVDEETSEESEETQSEEVAEDTEEQSEESETIEVPQISDLNELASAIEVDAEFLYGIKIPMPDGEEPITLSELKDGYTKFKRGSSEEREALEEERAAFDDYKQSQAEMLQQQMQLPQEIVAAQAEAMAIAYQYQNYNWEELEKANPGQAALQKQNMASLYQQAQDKLQGLNAQYQHQLSETVKEHTRKEFKAMLHYIPEWKDDAVRLKDQELLRSMLKGYGYSDKDINNLADHRAMRLARDLWKLKSQVEKVPATLKKLAKVPKTLKPRAAAGVPSKEKQQRELVKKAAESPFDRDKVDAISNLLRGKP